MLDLETIKRILSSKHGYQMYGSLLEVIDYHTDERFMLELDNLTEEMLEKLQVKENDI